MCSIARVALFVALVTAGCSDIGGLPTVRDFDNRTGMDITVIWLRENGDRTPQVTIPAGKTAWVGMNQFGNPSHVCGDGDLVVRGPSGEELIRRQASCEPWIIRLPAVPKASISDRTWVLTSLAKPNQSRMKPAARSTLAMAADGTFTVTTGCYTLVGHWVTSADEVDPMNLTTTGSACPSGFVDQNDQVSQVVGRAFAVHIERDVLSVTSNYSQTFDWQLFYAEEPAPP